MKARLKGLYSIKLLLLQVYPFTGVNNNLTILSMALDHLELVILDDFKKVFNKSIKDFLRFNYEKMKNKYGWAWN